MGFTEARQALAQTDLKFRLCPCICPLGEKLLNMLFALHNKSIEINTVGQVIETKDFKKVYKKRPKNRKLLKALIVKFECPTKQLNVL